jgi:hypothetical protein
MMTPAEFTGQSQPNFGLGDVGDERFAAGVLKLTKSSGIDIDGERLDAFAQHPENDGFADAAASAGHDSATSLR